MTRDSISSTRTSAAAAATGIITTAIALVLAVLSPPAAAHAGGAMQGTVWLLGALPQGEFKDNVEQNGFGLGGSFSYRVPESPVHVGAELDFAVYGQSQYEAFFAGLPVRVNVQTDNSILQGLLLLRLQPFAGPIRPYADGLFGFNYLFTTTTIKDRRNEEEIASDKNLDDTALAYGGGGGIMFRLMQRDPGPEKSGIRAVLLDLRARYLVGAEAKYLKEGTIQVVNNELVYSLQQSKTDLVTVGAGVTIEF
jgi:hypothetical protein